MSALHPSTRPWVWTVVFVCFGSASPAPAQNLESVEIRTERVAEGLYVLYGAGGNIGLAVGPDAVFIVDDQFAPLTPKILTAIRELTEQPVRFVLNTHWHSDHVGGNEPLGRSGALLVAHDNVRERMSTRQFMEFMQEEVAPAPPQALPVVTFSDAVTFHINEGEVQVLHVPHAHTDGDAVVFFEAANAVHMGDVYVRYGYPFVDLSAGGSVSGMIAAVDEVLERIDEDTRVIPGHGPVGDREALRRYRDVIAAIRDRVAARVMAGATLEEVLASRPSAEFDEEWSGSFVDGEAFVTFAY